jgi:hypothetical protein
MPLGVVALKTSLPLLFSLSDVSAATSMTLLRRESQPISEGQTIIRSHYLRERPAIGGVRLAPTTVTQEIIVVGCGVNYDANRGAGQPSWLPSQAALQPSAQTDVAFECTANPLEIRLPADSGHPLQIAKNGAQVSCRLLGAGLVAAEKKDDQTVRYSNVFPDTDLEWKIGKGFLKESLIVRSRNAPAVFSFSLQTDAATKLLVSDRSAQPPRQRDLLASQTAAPERIRGAILISRDERSTRGLIRIAPATVRDADGYTTRMITTVLCGPDRSLLYTIAIPKEFYSDPARKFPLVVDPTFINVPPGEGPRVYEAGKTYYIEPYVVYEDGTVTVEANAILKFKPSSGPGDPSGSLGLRPSYNATNPMKLYVQGTPYNYAIFTSGYDDSVGVDTDGSPGLPLTEEHDPQPGDYGMAIWYNAACERYNQEADEIEINYAKFAYAWYGLSVDSAVGSVEVSVKDSIFRQDVSGIAFYGHGGGYSGSITASVENCLFLSSSSGGGLGICLWNGNLDIEVRNCTFYGYVGPLPYAIWFDNYYEGTAIRYGITNNIFAHSGTAIHVNAVILDPSWIDYSGLDDVQYYYDGESLSEGYTIGPNCFFDDDPFDENANGSYYLKTDSEFRNFGYGTPQDAGLSTKTTTAVSDANGRIKRNNITQSETWTRFDTALDNDAHVDLGYHYDPVDIIVEPVYASQEADLHVSGTGTTLWINPGTVIAFSTSVTAGGENVSNYSRLSVVGGATIDAQGNGPQPISFTSSAASGDQIGHPRNDGQGRYIWYDTAIHLDVAGPNTRIRYCNFQFMGYGMVVESWSHPTALDINNCRFGFGDIGIAANSTVLGKTGVKVRNSLLHRLASAGVETFSPALDSEVLVENCTFDQGTKGVYAYSAQTTIRNCIFANTGYGIFVQFGNALKAENHNCFYQSSILFERDPSDIWQVDPQFDPGSPPVANIDERYYLNQSASPCINAGDPTVECYQTTARYLGLDYTRVDIGYHYPVRGRLKIAPNFFFEWENGESFYPIGAENMPFATEDSWPPSYDFYPTTVPGYLACLKNHGINTMQILPFATSRHLQNQEGIDFLQPAVMEYNSYFDALEGIGLYYMVGAYDYPAITSDTYANPTDNCIYLDKWPGGTVPWHQRGEFFLENTAARVHFKHSLDQFLENQYANPKWFMRDGFVRWHAFSEIDLCELCLPWPDGCDPSRYYDPVLMGLREDTLTSWVTDMLGHIRTGEENRLGAGRRRLAGVVLGNLRRFKQWDPDWSQPEYVDIASNDYIDYHLYTHDGISQATEAPEDHFSPLKYYLGVDTSDPNGLYWNGCTLPQIIDHYRKATSPRRGGFFSSEFGLLDCTIMERKRLFNECYHNYLWLAFATGSVGGPIPCWLRMYYDLSGIEYMNPLGYPLNCYTDEILDSMLSLSRFVSLVQWQHIQDPAANPTDSCYRPMRVTKLSGGPGVTLKDPSTWQPLSENEWLWTGASDGTITVGWIVRNYPRNYDIPEYEDVLAPIPPPIVTISGLAHVPLELVWFDDRTGCLIGNREVRSDGAFNNIWAPNTEPGGFGKSMAFLIQPVGFTPNWYFEPLPDEIIGQIEVSPRFGDWHEEFQSATTRTVTFTMRTKPAITNPLNYKFEWNFGDGSPPQIREGDNQISHTFTGDQSAWHTVKVDIKDKTQQDRRVSGDMLEVYVF